MTTASIAGSAWVGAYSRYRSITGITTLVAATAIATGRDTVFFGPAGRAGGSVPREQRVHRQGVHHGDHDRLDQHLRHDPTFAGDAIATTGMAARQISISIIGRPGAPRSIARNVAKNRMPTAMNSATGVSRSSTATAHTNNEATPSNR
jgi:hypothetical protein